MKHFHVQPAAKRKPLHYQRLLKIGQRIDKDFGWAVHPALTELRTLLSKLGKR